MVAISIQQCDLCFPHLCWDLQLSRKTHPQMGIFHRVLHLACEKALRRDPKSIISPTNMNHSLEGFENADVLLLKTYTPEKLTCYPKFGGLGRCFSFWKRVIYSLFFSTKQYIYIYHSKLEQIENCSIS